MEFLHNVHLDALEQTKQYKALEKEVERSLYHQWEDLITSGLINEVEELIKKKHLPVRLQNKVQKAVRAENVLPKNEDNEVELKYKKALFIAVLALIRKHLRPLRKYFSLPQLFQETLVFFATKGGQQILDQISDATNTRPKTFQLTNEVQQRQLKNRVDGLLPALDITTENELAKKLITTFEDKNTKKQIVAALLLLGSQLAELRASRIVGTEVVSAYENTRRLAAKYNGVGLKTWLTAGDARVCSKCSISNRETVGIDEVFSNGMSNPIAHVRCRCTVSYYIDFSDALGRLQTTSKAYNYQKSFTSDPTQFYADFDTSQKLSLPNPNALWTGGYGLVGDDKAVGSFAQHLELTPAIRALLGQNESGLFYVDEIVQRWKQDYIADQAQLFNTLKNIYTPEEILLISARFRLTDLGFLQLLASKGYDGSVYVLHDHIPLEGTQYTDIERREAQHKAKDLAVDGLISVADTGLTVNKPVDKLGQKSAQTEEVAVDAIAIDRPYVKLQRVLNIMDNFREAQRKGGGAVQLIQLADGTYQTAVDGRHRVVSAKLLGLQTITAFVYR